MGLDKHIGKKLTGEPSSCGFKICNKPNDEKIVFGLGLDPKTTQEYKAFEKSLWIFSDKKK